MKSRREVRMTFLWPVEGPGVFCHSVVRGDGMTVYVATAILERGESRILMTTYAGHPEEGPFHDTLESHLPVEPERDDAAWPYDGEAEGDFDSPGRSDWGDDDPDGWMK